MTNLLPTIVGAIAALCSVFSFMPQALKIWRERDASSVSTGMYVVTVAGFLFWVAYGVLLKSWPLVGSNAACLVLSAVILTLRIRFGGRS